MRCLWFFLFTSILGYLVRIPVLDFLKAPLFAALPPDKQHLYFTGLFENFLNHLKISMVTGFFLGSPYFFYQLWAFVAPGLYEKEKKVALPFVAAATLFFFLGAAFAYYMVFPYGFKFFLTFGGPIDVPMITIREYFSVLFRLLLFFGLAFELPVFLVLLAKIGIVNAEMLKGQRRNMIIGITLVSALFAPPDLLSMLFLMAPLYLFFEGAVALIGFMERKK